MTAYSAPGFLVPDDLESVFPPAEDRPDRIAAFPPSRSGRQAGDGLVYRDPAMFARGAARPAHRPIGCIGSGARRIRHRQGGHRPLHPPQLPARRRSVRCRQLRRDPGTTARIRVVRPRARRVFRRPGQRIGKLEAAQNGTILLDEISEMDRRLQAKLLRALQEREIDRIGGRAPIRLNVRIIATTNKDLEQEVARQNFREDLYFRLNVVAIHIPSLRDRPKDIAALAEHFIEKYRWESGRAPRQLSAAALNALMAHDWPGNVRELENTIHRALVLTTDSVIGAKALEVGPPSACRAGTAHRTG